MLLITDFLLTLSDAGRFIPLPHGQVTAYPSVVPLFLKNPSGSFQEMEFPSPVAVSDATGKYSLTLPWPSESNPSTVSWQITMPDGTVWGGIVPEGQVGPLTINTLKGTYSWQAVQGAGPTSSALPNLHAFTHEPGGTDDLFLDFGHMTAVTHETCRRSDVSGGVTGSNGRLFVSYFTARAALASVKVFLSTRAPFVAPTLARVGLWSSNNAGDLLGLVAAIPSTPALFTAAGIASAAWSALYTLIPGQRYAIGYLVVGATTLGALDHATNLTPDISGATAGLPPIALFFSGLADLPASLLASTAAGSSYPFYAVISS